MKKCSTTSGGVNQTFIIKPGDTFDIPCSGISTNQIFSCDGDTSILLSTDYIVVEGGIIPDVDGVRDLGLPNRRFRNVNTLSGTSTVWTATEVFNTPDLNFGLYIDVNQRNITADNSVIQDDILNGGNF